MPGEDLVRLRQPVQVKVLAVCRCPSLCLCGDLEATPLPPSGFYHL